MPSPPNRFVVLLLAGIVLLAFLLRIYRSGTYGIFFDEKSTLLISQGVVLEGANQPEVFDKPYFTPKEFWNPKSFADFVEANIRGDIGNSPAYYGVLWLWIEAFGKSDFAIRFPSVIFSTLTVLLLYLFVKRHFRSESLALTSSAIAAVEPFFVSYSHMARNYSMTFLLTLLATHLFLLVLEREWGRKRSLSLYILYGLTVAVCILSHYLTVTVFLCHGLYALLYLRTLRVWIRLAVTAAAALAVVAIWFIDGGGKYTFFTLNYQAGFYRNLALTNPTNNGFGLILPATISNVFHRSLPIFSDLILFTNGLANALAGYRNLLLAILCGLVAVGILHRFRGSAHPPRWVKAAFPLVLVAAYPLYTVNPLQFIILSAAFPLYYLMAAALGESASSADRRLWVFMIILSLIPTLFLLFMAFRSGHTYGITQRYSGFSFPYAIILVALTFQKVARLPGWAGIPLAVILLVQGVYISRLLQRIYNDSDPKYTYFFKPRLSNPFWESANRLKELYAPGDTILYPSLRRHEYTRIDRIGRSFSVIDAQLVNVYLPEDAEYIQRIDPKEPDKIVLVKGKTGQKITIFDFDGMTYRY